MKEACIEFHLWVTKHYWSGYGKLSDVYQERSERPGTLIDPKQYTIEELYEKWSK